MKIIQPAQEFDGSLYRYLNEKNINIDDYNNYLSQIPNYFFEVKDKYPLLSLSFLPTKNISLSYINGILLPKTNINKLNLEEN